MTTTAIRQAPPYAKAEAWPGQGSTSRSMIRSYLALRLRGLRADLQTARQRLRDCEYHRHNLQECVWYEEERLAWRALIELRAVGRLCR